MTVLGFIVVLALVAAWWIPLAVFPAEWLFPYFVITVIPYSILCGWIGSSL